MKVVDPKTPFEYVLKAERDLPVEEQSVFMLKRLSAREEAVIQDRLTSRIQTGKDVRTDVHSGTYILQTLRAGLVGWRNVTDDTTGSEVAFNEKNKDGMLDFLPGDVRDELFTKIRGMAEVSEEEEGN